MRLPLVALALLSAGCGACGGITTTHGVENLYAVDPNVYRSAQPTTAEGWQYLYSLGIRVVVKLNFDSEGSDDGARALGMTVFEFGVQPNGDLISIVELPDAVLLAGAEAVIAEATSDRRVLVHCTHGQDRTGLAIGMHRVLHEGWTKDRAFDEMTSRGFHVELVGLDDFWLNFDPKAFP